MKPRPAGLSGARWGGIRGKLFMSYLLVVGVGILTLFLGVSYLGPALFDRSMMPMMGDGGSGMMGGMGQSSGQTISQLMGNAITNSFRGAVTTSLLLSTLAGAGVAGLASYLFARRVVAPVRRLAWASRRIAAGHYAERVTRAGDDELGELADSFNQMATALEEAERRRLALVGDVAHELRTPLSTIEGYAEGLLDGIVSNSPETFALLHREARRLRRLVDDLQELSRVEARQVSLHQRSVAPGQIVAAAVDRLRPHFVEKGLEVEVAVPEEVELVRADEDRAVQVLTNLLGNSLRYTPVGGQVAVRVRQLEGFVEFAVADSGIGIAAEQLPHIFERFYRVDRSRSRAGGGSGIGTTIARHLVEAQGGTIRAESPGLGLGATFLFTLPVARG